MGLLKRPLDRRVSPGIVRAAIATMLLALSTLISMAARVVLESPAHTGTSASEKPRTLVDLLAPPHGSRDAAGDTASAEISFLIDRAETLSRDLEDARADVEAQLKKLAATPSILPTSGRLSSAYSSSRLHPLLGLVRPHLGLDIRAPAGTPIRAPASGRVRFVGWRHGYGLTAEIDHGYGYVTRYAHASRITVRVGDRVERGDKIGEVGATGLAEAPHLHYEVLVNGKQANPRRFIYGARDH